jgi:predicted enzyme related to lactoylglutathione lyase
MVDHTIVHFEIPAENVEKLMKFYRDLFGWRMEKAEGMDYWLIETVPVDEKRQPIRQGVNGGMYKKGQPETRILNYFAVESVDEYLKKITALGGKTIMSKQEIPQIGWSAIAADPEGNYFALFQGI